MAQMIDTLRVHIFNLNPLPIKLARVAYGNTSEHMRGNMSCLSDQDLVNLINVLLSCHQTHSPYGDGAEIDVTDIIAIVLCCGGKLLVTTKKKL